MKVRLPFSKSIGARYLVCSYFAGTLGQTPAFTDSDDLRVIRKALFELEINREWLDSGFPPIDVHASGTAFRLMAAAIASTPLADFLLTGTERLCGRPMGPLIGILRDAGAKIEARGADGKGPYRILGRRLRGGEFEIEGNVSSQFITALMLAAPTWRGGMKLRFSTPLVSAPYVAMTAKVMERFGVSAIMGVDSVEVHEGQYLAPRNFNMEADWSAAGFFYEAVALGSGDVMIEGLESPLRSMQGDSATASVFAALGVDTMFSDKGAELERNGKFPERLDLNMENTPDLVPALTVACALNGVKFRLEGVRNLRVKESDRLEVLKRELYKLGYTVGVEDDAIFWEGEMGEDDADAIIDTYDDHRIAMAFAMSALKRGSIRINRPEVVDKSFSDFWNQLPAVGLRSELIGDTMYVARIRKV